MIFHKIRKNDPNFDVSLGPYGGGGSSISFSAAHSKGFWYRFSAMTVPEKVHGVGSSGSAHRSVKFCARIRASSPLRLFLMATWKSGLGNDIYYIHRSVKPVKWPVADGGEEKVAFLREFF